MSTVALFFGQYLEIYGISHGFIPIVIESTTFPNFKNYYIILIINFYIINIKH